MAKAKTLEIPADKKTFSYPSRFGSHASMIDEEKTKELNNPLLVVLKDDLGHYTTERKRLDTGMGDPNRYAESRLEKLFVG